MGRDAVSALAGVMSPLLGKLGSLIEKEYAELRGARKKLEQLRKELMAINLALEKYSAMENPDVQAKAWASEIRELAYDMEDAIDLFTCRAEHDQPAAAAMGAKRIVLKILRKARRIHHRHRLAKQMDHLQVLANEAYMRHKRYKLEQDDDTASSSSSSMVIDPRLPALYVEAEKLMGIEGPSNEIIEQLVGGEPAGTKQQRRVVAVVGSGGSGKTTLARQVFERISSQFSCAAFVSVSRKPNVSNILRELLSRIWSNHHGSSGAIDLYSDEQLIDRLRACLENERYLVVIDDIWQKSAWEIIQCALPKNSHANRIITTTRIRSVAEFCCTSCEGFVYQMKPLSKSDSENLFLKRTFGAGEKCPSHLEGVINKILYKCDGLPLAIVTLASLLADKPRREEEWERVLNYIVSMPKKDNELEVMDKILSLSYNDLPHHMKNCFLYLGSFPEDHHIGKDILVWKWIAEGFIVAKHGFTLEEVAESYFYELINRSLVQPVNMVHGVSEQGCQVHDIVLNFILSRSAEENFLTILDGHHEQLPSSRTKIRRLSVWNKQECATLMSQGSKKLPHVRAISMFHVDGWTVPPVWDLPVLRVLDLEGCHALRNDHLNCIVNLFHLRYLRLCKTSIDSLPVQIGKLEYLQTLDVSSSLVRRLPESIIQIKRMTRLVGDELVLSDGFGNMESLQELGVLDGCSCSLNFGKDLELLTKLRVLRVMFRCEETGDLDTRKKHLMSSLCKLGGNSLRSLYIQSSVTGVDCSADSWCPPPILLQKFEYRGVRYFSSFPRWIKPSLAHLAYMDFRIQQMEQGDLRVLQSLPALRVLCLSVKQVLGDGLIVSHGAFHSLTRLGFCNIDGPALMFGADVPRLEWLKLEFNASRAQSTYGSLVAGVQHLSSLKCIDLTVGMISETEDESDPTGVKSIISRQVKMLPNNPKVNITFL
ncbi:disease resistance protein RGA5-like [Oryza brachyantha]|uniref:AAA+ ATPase domain-containing protein n=1 Tax=Oryza brachyantha TaxID=4533 RepID=J3N731_ORYBR|nr:disease resistance protein RGA5-like [Oryza brachyantha]